MKKIAAIVAVCLLLACLAGCLSKFEGDPTTTGSYNDYLSLADTSLKSYLARQENMTEYQYSADGDRVMHWEGMETGQCTEFSMNLGNAWLYVETTYQTVSVTTD